MSQATGLSLQQVSALSYATEQFHLSQDVLNSSMSAFSRYLIATKGSAADIQKELAAAANQFQIMPPGIERNALALKMFGEAGLKLLPILSQGAQGLDQFAQAADRAGRLVDEKAVAAAKRFEEAQRRMEDAQNKTNVVIGNLAIPLLAQLYENSNRATDGGNRLSQAWELVGQSLNEIATRGAVTNETFSKLDGSIQLVLAAVFGLNPALSGIANNFEAGGNAALGFGKKALTAADYADVATQRYIAMAGAMGGLTQVVGVEQFNARMEDLARSQAMTEYTQRRFNDANKKGRYEMYASSEVAHNYTYRLAKTTSSTEKMGMATAGATSSFLKMASGGGSAAAAIDKVSAAEDELNQRTQNMQGLMGNSLEPMNKMQKLQSAYALATGQTTLAQEQMKISVQGVMKGFDAGSISMSDALGLVLALRNGQIDYTRALQAAGPAAQPYINDLNEFTAAATDGTAKVLQLSQGVDKLPGAPVPVAIDVKTTGGAALDDLHDRVMSLPTEKTVTIKAVVVGLDQLAGTFYDYAPRTGSQPVIPTGGNLDTPQGNTPAGSPQTVNVNVDGATVARANVNNGARPTAQNTRRNYRQP